MMKIIMVGGIPHWESAGVQLPIIAGGDKHIPGQIGTTTATATAKGTSFLGVDLFYPDGTYAGRIYRGRVPLGGGEAPLLLSIPATDTEGAKIVPFGGGSFVTQFNEGITLDSSGLLISSRDLPFPKEPSAGGPGPSFASSQAAQTQTEEFQGGENAEDRALTERLAQLRIDNEALLQSRTDLRGVYQAALGIKAQRQGQLESLYAETQNILGETLGKDVVRGAIRGQGGLARGVTPNEGFRRGVRGVGGEAQAALAENSAALTPPNLNASLADTLAQTEAIQAYQPPELPSIPTGPFIGAAEGAVIEGVARGPSLPNRGVRFGTTKTAVIVGDREINGDEEVVIQDRLTGQTEIIPIAGPAQEGATFDGFDGFKFDASTVQQALSPIYKNLGISKPPILRRGPEGEIFGTGFSGVDTFRKLGVSPRLVRDSATSNVFLIENGKHRYISPETWAASGLQRRDIVNLSHEDVLKLAPTRGADVPTDLPLFATSGSGERFPTSPTPISIGEGPEGLSNLALPAPRTFRMDQLSPSTRDVIMSALGLADYSRADIEEEQRFFRPAGSARAPRSALLA